MNDIPLRLLHTPPASGAWNMACDEILLDRAANGKLVLRFYEWAPATLSLGYFQAFQDRNSHLASVNCPLVRRATGGGAIVHDRELTYSFTAPAGHPLTDPPANLYDGLHNAIIRALANWGAGAQQCRAEKTAPNASCEQLGKPGPFLCFQRHCRGDVLINDDKVVGSAQRRQRRGVLQHGSILLQASRFAPELPGLAELTGRSISGDELRIAVVEEVRRELAAAVEEDQLTAEEVTATRAAEQTRFGNENWTRRR